MLSDIEAGFVNCVIVKDLSRLGRNSIDTGYYIEQYFTAHHVRFIAVTDQFDTADPNDIHAGIILPLKNMINEAYAIDIGRKIKAQQRQAMKDGEYIGARSPYGYLKAPDNCHQLIIDPQTAPVVRQIFQWALEGAGLNAIARRLNEAGIVSVSVYKQQIGQITHENLIGNGKWQTRTVNKILRCETYTGDLVQGHSKSIDHRQVRAGADNLITVQNTHEAIISHNLFAQVQSILDATAGKCRNRAVSSYTPNLLKGKVFCAHCGTALHRQRNSRKKSDDVYIYHCLTNSRVAKDSCLGVTIREDKLMPVLLDIMQTQMETTLGQYALLLADDEQREKERRAISAKLGVCRQDIAQYRSRIRGLYENLVQGVISNEEYFSLADSERKLRAKTLKSLQREMRSTTASVPLNDSYKTIQYVRYADDFIIGVIGSKKDAQQIKSDVKRFLTDRLKLKMSDEKTKITHTGDRARFLGYDITVSRSQHTKKLANGNVQRCNSYVVQLLVPREKWVGKLLEYNAMKVILNENGKEKYKSLHRGKLINKSDIEILSAYNSEIRGLYNFYSIANDSYKIGIFANIMKYSMFKTFANKYKTNVHRIKGRFFQNGNFTVEYQTKSGKKQAVYYNKGFKRKLDAMTAEVNILPQYQKYDRFNSLKNRIKLGLCELCGKKSSDISLHQVAKMKDLTGNTAWELLMLERRRKTLAVCPECHNKIHS